MTSYLSYSVNSSEISETLQYVARKNGQGCVFDIGDMGVDRKDCLDAGRQLGFHGDSLQIDMHLDSPTGCYVLPDIHGGFNPEKIHYNTKYRGTFGYEAYFSICHNLKDQGECRSTNIIEKIRNRYKVKSSKKFYKN